LRQLPSTQDRNVLVGSATADDAGVYRLDRTRALVQTLDFFTPIVDDPYLYGQIAAANALSDVYAMGGRPVTAMNIMGVPEDLVPPEVIRAILRGGAVKVKEAGCALVGGHTIRNPEPIYGLSVTGFVRIARMITNGKARPGDHLVLTKPLGTGIITTGIKRDSVTAATARKAINLMRRLNSVGPLLAEHGLVRAGTDVTGFGVLGHLTSMCRASGVGAELEAGRLPVISEEVRSLIRQDCIPGGSRENLRAAESIVDWQDATNEHQALLSDAQTSGGLLLAVAPGQLEDVLRMLKKAKTPCAVVIGKIVRSRAPRILVRA
jgi:selenide, water dikinase